MNKSIFLNIVLLFTTSFTVSNKIQPGKNRTCHELTKEYFEQFVTERDDLEKNLKKILDVFDNNKLESFVSLVNKKTFNSEHTYPFLMEESKVIAHGLKPISYFEDISCEDHERHNAWDILMSSIYTAKKFPIIVYYHLDNRLRETLIQKVTKDCKEYYLGIGFFVK